jgi:dimeric dUTPase (all-alpha-NTP-PPase superfamily)
MKRSSYKVLEAFLSATDQQNTSISRTFNNAYLKCLHFIITQRIQRNLNIVHLVPAEFQLNSLNIKYIQNVCVTSDLNQCPFKQGYKDGFQSFRERTPGAGAYFNEADIFESDFQDNFYTKLKGNV